MHRVVISNETLLDGMNTTAFFSGVYRETTFLKNESRLVHRYINQVPCTEAF